VRNVPPEGGDHDLPHLVAPGACQAFGTQDRRVLVLDRDDLRQVLGGLAIIRWPPSPSAPFADATRFFPRATAATRRGRPPAPTMAVITAPQCGEAAAAAPALGHGRAFDALTDAPASSAGSRRSGATATFGRSARLFGEGVDL